jgi:hypothetical protein
MLREWISDFFLYLGKAAQRWVGSAIALASVLLVILSDLRGHTLGLPIWAWGLIAMGGVLIAGFTEWRALHHNPEHIARIRNIAVGVYDSLRSGPRIQYSEGGRSDPVLKTMFQGHCPKGLAALLDEWDGRKRKEPALRDASILRMQGAARERIESQFPTDEWHTASIVLRTSEYIDRRFKTGAITAPPLIQFGTGTVVWQGTILKWIDLSDPDGKREAEVATDLLRATIDEVASTWPAAELQAMSDRRERIEQEVSEPLQMMMYDRPIRGRCPGCRP